MRARLRHVYWIGGGSGAGKSVTARRLAARHGLRLYSTDDAMAEHARRCAPADGPYLSEFAAMDMDERWVNRSPATMLETFGWFRGEGFGLIVEDLLSLPGEPGVIVEGFRLLPHLVKPLLAKHGHAVWLLPTPGFRRAAFDRRGSLWQIAGKTNDPERALANLLERDRLFTERLFDETERLGLRAIGVDATITEDGLAELVTEGFAHYGEIRLFAERKFMDDTVLSDAAERAKALFTDWSSGHYDRVVAGFDTTMTARLPVDQLTAAWTQVLGLVGSYQRMGEPLVRELGGYTVVDIPMTFEAGQMKGRVSYNGEGQVSGLFVLTPETP